MSLREKVYIKTPTVTLDGELFVGTDGLPELEVLGGGYHEKGCYTPATLPNEWTVLMDIESLSLGPLFHAWRDIEDVRQGIRDAQREADTEVEICRQGDGYVSHDFVGENCIRCGLSDRDCAQQRDIDNRIAMEIDERRATS